MMPIAGVLNHHLLELHNVADVQARSLGFMIIAGVFLQLLGWLLARAGGRSAG